MSDEPKEDVDGSSDHSTGSEDDKPLAPKPIVSTDKANQRLKSPNLVSEDSGKPPAVDNGDIPYRTLIGLQSIYPFSRYFQSLADKEHKESSNSSTRFRKHKENHDKLWRLCVVCDLIVIALIWVLIFVGLAFTVYKTLVL